MYFRGCFFDPRSRAYFPCCVMEKRAPPTTWKWRETWLTTREGGRTHEGQRTLYWLDYNDLWEDKEHCAIVFIEELGVYFGTLHTFCLWSLPWTIRTRLRNKLQNFNLESVSFISLKHAQSNEQCGSTLHGHHPTSTFPESLIKYVTNATIFLYIDLWNIYEHERICCAI